MDNDDWDYFTTSVGEQLLLILWTSLGTLAVVGFILGIALRQVYDNRTLTTRKEIMITLKYREVSIKIIRNGGLVMEYEPPIDDDFALGKLDDLDENGEPDEADEPYDTLEEKYQD